MRTLANLLASGLATLLLALPASAERIEKDKLEAMAQFLPPPGDAKRQQGPASVRDDFSGITWHYVYTGKKRISVQVQAGKRFVDSFKPIAADKGAAARYGYEIVKIKGRDVLFRAKPNKPGIDDDYNAVISDTRQVIVKAQDVEAAELRAFVEKIDFDGIAKAK